MKDIDISKYDETMYFEWSQNGKHKDKIATFPYVCNGFNALIQGKIWRGRHMEMYEEGVMDLSMPYFTLLGGLSETKKRKWWQFGKPEYIHITKPIPRLVVSFMKREMFKGMDADIIQNCYDSISQKQKNTLLVFFRKFLFAK